jgi:hypothetical protein
MKFRTLTILLGSLLLGRAAQGAVTFEIGADWLTANSSNNSGLPDGSVIFFVADTTNSGFSAPSLGHMSVGSLWGGSTNDVVLAEFAANGNSNFGTAGVQDTVISNLNYSNFTTTTIPTLAANVAPGDDVALFWFSSISDTNSDTLITGNAVYGYFDTLSTGSDAASWVLPNDVTTGTNFNFASSNAQIFPTGSDVARFATTIPEPSTYALIGGLCALGFTKFRRQRVKVTA